MASDFATRLLAWFDEHGRHDLPWQKNPTPYRVWVSEIMLQQTQVTTVISYYQRFMKSFPSLESLANASQDDVLAHWSGLGYYARARNLHKTAELIQVEHHGIFPDTQEGLEALPGIGRSTAGAIRALAMEQYAVILDGNVKRVLCRHNAVSGWPGKSAVMKKLWLMAEAVTPKKRVAAFTQAIMDLGATLCTRSRPQCNVCPLTGTCVANAQQNPTAYPEKKPRKEKPQREEVHLVLINRAGEVHLQRRPEKGIWGGLWTFPVLPENQNYREWLSENHYVELKSKSMRKIRHQFSHFDLGISPMQIWVDTEQVRDVDAPNVSWSHPDVELPGGVPAPIAKLLQRLSGALSA